MGVDTHRPSKKPNRTLAFYKRSHFALITERICCGVVSTTLCNVTTFISIQSCINCFDITLHYITCHLADAFIQSDLQLIRLSRRHTPWSNVGLRALLKGPTAVQIFYRGRTWDRTTDLAGPSQVA